MKNKLEEMMDWLVANPGKSRRDWLLEVRCTDDVTRNAVVSLLDALDSNNIDYGIVVEVKNWTPEYEKYPLNELESAWFDIMIVPGIGKNSYLIEVDMPDTVLGTQIENRYSGESIPDKAFVWLLKKWFPEFDLESVYERHRRKLMWEDMGGLLCGIIGSRGFPNWKNATFVDHVVATYKRDIAMKNALKNQ